ncbi:MAG: hypothetical protein Q8N05_05565 [Bacteroidota bacterium]|nr:hypothetical protein [Bacteroidota bacterium]
MKTKMSIILVLIMVFTNSCGLYDDLFDTVEENSFVADISSTTEFDYLVFFEKDESFLAIDQENVCFYQTIPQPVSTLPLLVPKVKFL